MHNNLDSSVNIISSEQAEAMWANMSIWQKVKTFSLGCALLPAILVVLAKCKLQELRYNR